MYPFMFYKSKDIHGIEGVTRDTWYVIIAKFISYVEYQSEWMEDDDLGEFCLVPDVDLEFEKHKFYSEGEAIDFIRDWWKKQ